MGFRIKFLITAIATATAGQAGCSMFTGLIERTGEIKKIQSWKSGKILQIYSKFDTPAHRLEACATIVNGESIAINGVCLTVTKANGDLFEVYASANSLSKTNLSKLRQGQFVNLERALKLSDRIGGHLVQGHIDAVAKIIDRKIKGDSVILAIECKQELTKYIIQSGSIAINGVSLTVAKKTNHHFEIAIIPYTLSNTTLGNLRVGELVNVETDIIGKYLTGSEVAPLAPDRG